MDGKKLVSLVLDYLDELKVTSAFASELKIYENLDLAASIFLRETGYLHSNLSITTVEDQQEYDIPPGYIRPYMRNPNGRWYGRYYNATEESYCYPVMVDYNTIFAANRTESKSNPSCFAIIDKPTQEDLIEGTITTGDEGSGGQCTLEDSTKLFTTTNKVYERDIVHNTLDGENGSTGYVLKVTDATHLEVALFGDSDCQCNFAEDDTYVIQPASEFQLIFDAPVENAGDTFTLPYVCMPSPVYSDYGFWRFPPRVCKGIAYGAASLFKTPVKDYVGAEQIGGLFSIELSTTKREIAQNVLKTSRRSR